MPPNVLITEGYFNLGFPSPPPALPPPPPAPEIKPTGPRRGGSPPGPPARTHDSCVSIIFSVDRERAGHKLRRLGNVLWRKEAKDPAGSFCALQVGSRLAMAEPVVGCVGVLLAGVVCVLSVLYGCCLCPRAYRQARGASGAAGSGPGWGHGCICLRVLQTFGWHSGGLPYLLTVCHLHTLYFNVFTAH